MLTFTCYVRELPYAEVPGKAAPEGATEPPATAPDGDAQLLGPTRQAAQYNSLLVSDCLVERSDQPALPIRLIISLTGILYSYFIISHVSIPVSTKD